MKQKIFLLYPYYWPNYRAGGPVQSLYNIVDTLKDDVEFYLISKSSDTDGTMPKPPLQLNQWVSGNFQEHVYYTTAITPSLIFRLLNKVRPHAVMVNGVFNASTTLPGLLAAKWLGIKIIFSPRGMLQAWGLKRGRFKKLIFLQLLKLILHKNEEWHATDGQEKSDILKIFGAHQLVHVASNIPRKVSGFAQLTFPTQREKIKLVFLSLINPNKNLHLIIDAVKGNEKFTLDIYGPIANEAYWEACKHQMKGESAIQYRGAVPPWNISETLKEYHFFVLPTQGENFGHAIFDALASGVPVIVSRNTPWKDIDITRAGFYTGLETGNLDLILAQVAAMTGEMYTVYRTSAHAYAQRFFEGKDYRKEYAFLIA